MVNFSLLFSFSPDSGKPGNNIRLASYAWWKILQIQQQVNSNQLTPFACDIQVHTVDILDAELPDQLFESVIPHPFPSVGASL